MNSLLFSWLGEEDLQPRPGARRGALEEVLLAGDYDEAHLLSPFPRARTAELAEELWQRTSIPVVQHFVNFEPDEEHDFGRIHSASMTVLTEALSRRPGARTTFHLGSGTGEMIASWIVLARTRVAARLVRFARSRGVEPAAVPYDVSEEFVAGALRTLATARGETPRPTFSESTEDIRPMTRAVRRAERVASSDAPVLLEAEPGVDVEALARHIHERSRRAGGSFVSFRCRTVPPEHMEVVLFGRDAKVYAPPFEEEPGQLEAARGATFFLDEITALPLGCQARLARLICEGVVTRVGALAPLPVDVRIIAGSSRDLARELADGRLLEELYRQLSIAAIRVPSLRERADELPQLIDRILADTNARFAAMTPKRLAPEARSLLVGRAWPGNEAEMRGVLARLVVWAEHETVTESDVRQALPNEPGTERSDGVLGRSFDESFRMEDLLDEVSRSYILRALRESGGVKARAVELLGMSNATTLTNWMKRLGIDADSGKATS